MSDDIFDFGFTAVDESELKSVQQAERKVNTLSSKSTAVQDKLDSLYNAVTPLLNNLKKNPEKEYILWPDRIGKVEAFEDHLRKIYES